VPEFLDPVFVKTSPKCSFSVIENEHFGLVFVKTGSIILGTDEFFFVKPVKTTFEQRTTVRISVLRQITPFRNLVQNSLVFNPLKIIVKKTFQIIKTAPSNFEQNTSDFFTFKKQ
jgi:hypothetical protein